MNTRKKIVAVVGPTGSGKTSLAVSLAKAFNGVIISADSRQVYRGLDVGTAKEGVPGKWQNEPARLIDGVPQLLIDIIEPDRRFTLADWLTEARTKTEQIWKAGLLPIVTGGTGLYVTALLEGYQPGGGRFATLKESVKFTSLILQPSVARETLNKKSDQRFERIFDTLITETNSLLTSGVSAAWLNAIGLDYRYALKHITGELSRNDAISQYQRASRQYIRRQLTWWRHHGQPRLAQDTQEAIAITGEFCNS